MQRHLRSLIPLVLPVTLFGPACLDMEELGGADDVETSSTEQALSPFDFGYRRLEAIGARPTLVIVTDYAGMAPVALTDAEISALIFGPAYPSVNGWFQENSNGQFALTNDRTGVFRLALPASDVIAEGTPRLQNVKSRLIESGRIDLTRFDGPDPGTDVGTHELFIVVVENLGDQLGGATRGEGGCVAQNGKNICADGILMGGKASLMTFAHEMCHLLGAVDLYGGGGNHANVSTMGPTITDFDNDRQTYHLDPWHKLAFGWLWPRIGDIRTSSWDLLRAPHLARSGDLAMILWDPARGPGEYFFVEYRSNDNNTVQNHYDRHTRGNGMGVWHVKRGSDGLPVSGPSVVRTGALGWQEQRGYSWVARGGSSVTIAMAGDGAVALDVRIDSLTTSCQDSGATSTVACTIYVPVMLNARRDAVLDQTIRVSVRGDSAPTAHWAMTATGIKVGEPFVHHVGEANGELSRGIYWGSRSVTPSLIWGDGANTRTRLIPARFWWFADQVGVNWVNEDNYLIDPGFEWQAGTSLGWPWGRWGTSAGGIDTDSFAHGGRKNTWMRAISGFNAIIQDVPVPTDTCTFELTGWIKTSWNVTHAYFGIRDAFDNRLLGEVRFGPNNDYRRVAVIVNTGCAPDLRVFLGWWSPDSDSWMQIDDLQLRPIPPGSDSAPYP